MFYLKVQINKSQNAISQVRADLYRANEGCQSRGLWEYSTWISEQLVYLPKTNKIKIPDKNCTWNSDYDLISFALQLMHGQVCLFVFYMFVSVSVSVCVSACV